MKKKLVGKCRDRSGETFAETLVALLVSALAITMLAGSITTATKVAMRGEEIMTAYYAAINAVAAGKELSELSADETAALEKAGVDTATSFKSGKANVTLKPVGSAVDASADLLAGDGLTNVVYFLYTGLGKNPTAAYSYQDATLPEAGNDGMGG